MDAIDFRTLQREFVREMYGHTESKWRYFQNLRYIVIGFTATANAFLLSTYLLILNSLQIALTEGRHIFELSRYLLVVLPVLAVSSLIVSYLISRRLRSLYTVCSLTGAQLEIECDFKDGIFQRCNAEVKPEEYRRRGIPMTMLYAATFLMWLYVFWFGIHFLP